jgi:hypothetical protein
MERDEWLKCVKWNATRTNLRIGPIEIVEPGEEFLTGRISLNPTAAVYKFDKPHPNQFTQVVAKTPLPSIRMARNLSEIICMTWVKRLYVRIDYRSIAGSSRRIHCFILLGLFQLFLCMWYTWKYRDD